MTTQFKLFANLYKDSVTLMQLGARLRERDGIRQASCLMATPANLEQLAAADLQVDPLQHFTRAEPDTQSPDEHGRAHETNPRKLAQRCRPCGVRNDSGRNCTPKVGWLWCCTAITSPVGVRAVARRAGPRGSAT